MMIWVSFILLLSLLLLLSVSHNNEAQLSLGVAQHSARQATMTQLTIICVFVSSLVCFGRQLAEII